MMDVNKEVINTDCRRDRLRWNREMWCNSSRLWSCSRHWWWSWSSDDDDDDEISKAKQFCVHDIDVSWFHQKVWMLNVSIYKVLNVEDRNTSTGKRPLRATSGYRCLAAHWPHWPHWCHHGGSQQLTAPQGFSSSHWQAALPPAPPSDKTWHKKIGTGKF